MKYEKIYVKDKFDIDDIYQRLLDNRQQFININDEYVLTKEKSLLKITDFESFLKEVSEDVYYNTIFVDNCKFSNDDLVTYWQYIDKYKDRMRNKYGNKYLFGSIAVRTTEGFITTIRGKENLDEYTVVKSVDHENNLVFVRGKKATLNAPLLDNLFKNEKVRVIVHINHEYDENLDYYDYAFPGTVRDSFRKNNVSFNIRNHGVFYLFDKNGNML